MKNKLIYRKKESNKLNVKLNSIKINPPSKKSEYKKKNFKKVNGNSKKIEKLKKVDSKMANLDFGKEDIIITNNGYALLLAIKRQKFSDIFRLLEAGAHINLKNGLKGGGPFHHLIKFCPGDINKRFRIEVGQLLLEYGVDVNLIDFYGKTALMLAASEGQLELVKLLSQWPKTNQMIQDCRGNTALMSAIINNQVLSCKEILKSMQLVSVYNLKPEIMSNVLRIRNFNGYNALDLAKKLENPELILHLKQFIDYWEKKLFNTYAKYKSDQIDQKYYLNNYWTMKNMKPEFRNFYYPFNSPNNYFWKQNKSMESLSTIDDFYVDDEKIYQNFKKENEKKLKDSNKIDAVDNKNITEQEKVKKILSGQDPVVIDKKKNYFNKLNRAYSLYNLSPKYYDDYLLTNYINDDDSITSSVAFNHNLQKKLMQKNRDRLLSEKILKPDLLLSDSFFQKDPYQSIWEKETMSWFRENDEDAKLSKYAKPVQKIKKMNNVISKMSLSDEQLNKNQFEIKEDKKISNPVSNQRDLDYDTWVKMADNAFKKQIQ